VGENLIAIGRVSKPHGVNGEISIEYFNRDDLDAFSRYEVLFIQGDEVSPRPYRPTKIRPHKQCILVQLEGIQSKEEAERLRGKLVLVAADALPPLDADEYYWHEILGMRVVTEGGSVVGEVAEIVPTGSNDVYVVRQGKQEHLIPATKEVIIAIEKDTRTIIIRPLEGLLEHDDL
jgi:16S rRNA processing protein RimM